MIIGQSLTSTSALSNGHLSEFFLVLLLWHQRYVLLSYLWSFILIFSSQYLNDSTLKNVHWALCTGVFGKRDVGCIEREYLEVLNFELGVSEADLLSHHQGLLDAIMYLPRPAPCFIPHNSPRSQSMGRS